MAGHNNARIPTVWTRLWSEKIIKCKFNHKSIHEACRRWSYIAMVRWSDCEIGLCRNAFTCPKCYSDATKFGDVDYLLEIMSSSQTGQRFSLHLRSFHRYERALDNSKQPSWLLLGSLGFQLVYLMTDIASLYVSVDVRRHTNEDPVFGTMRCPAVQKIMSLPFWQPLRIASKSRES